MQRYMILLIVLVYLIVSCQLFCFAEDLEGLVVYFAFEDGSGKTVTDLSGNGNDGTLEGDIGWTDGKYGKGLNFGGKNGIVRVKHSHHFEFTDEITICAWVRPTLEVGAGTWQLIAAKGPDVDEFFEILLHPDGFIWMGWRLTGGRVVPAQSPRNVVKDKWQHVAVSFKTKDWWTVYLDGKVLINYPNQNEKLFPVESPLLLGTEEPINLNRFYNGEMDEFAIFNRGLTEKEIGMVQDGIRDLLPVEPTEKLPIVWGRLKSNPI